MSKNPLLFLLVAVLSFLLPSCELVGGIFKAGMWTGFIIIFVVVALIIWIIAKITRK